MHLILELYNYKSPIVYNLSPELRGQLQKFSVALVHLPPLVVDVTVNEHVTQLQKEREKAESTYQAQVQELERRKVRNRGVMRQGGGRRNERRREKEDEL